MGLLQHLSNRHELHGLTMDNLGNNFNALVLAAWARTTRRMRATGAFIIFVCLAGYLTYPTIQEMEVKLPNMPNLPNLPKVSLEYHYQQQASKFNESKVALLIENRPKPILAPLMLHFISVVPPDWRFRFMGSVESVGFLNQSMAIREHVAAGKLDLTYIPSNMSTGSQEEISRFLTTLWLYEKVLQPAEWLLVFQADSILCANSRQTLNDYLDYEWVGAPWNPHGRFGGNGGLSLRRVSTIIDILRHQNRVPGSEPEDVWLTDLLGHRPGAKLANGTISSAFSGEMNSGPPTRLDINGEGLTSDSSSSSQPGSKEYNATIEAAKNGSYVKGIDDWRDGFYEPMGYHTGGDGGTLHGAIWGRPELRKHIWDYCPEVKMTLQMDAAKYVPGQCSTHWKRWDMGETDAEADLAAALESRDIGYGTEIIDGKEYPALPPGLRPW